MTENAQREDNSAAQKDQPLNRSETPLNDPDKTPKKGAPYGNQNNLRHGAFSRDLQKAKKRKLRGKARRLQIETLAAVLSDQGNLEDIPITLQFVCQRFSKRVGRLHVMDKAIDKLIRQKPQLKDNPKALAALYDFVRPLERDAIDDAKSIGFERKKNDSEIPPWERDEEADGTDRQSEPDEERGP